MSPFLAGPQIFTHKCETAYLRSTSAARLARNTRPRTLIRFNASPKRILVACFRSMARAGPTWARLYFAPASDLDLLQRAHHALPSPTEPPGESGLLRFSTRSWQPRALPSPRCNPTCGTNAVAVTRQNTVRPEDSGRSRLPSDNRQCRHRRLASADDLTRTQEPTEHGNASTSCGACLSHNGTHFSVYAPSTRRRRWHGRRRDGPRAPPPRCPRPIAALRPARDRCAPVRHAR